MEQITLYYRQGPSDKIYQASIEQADGRHVVRFAYGRRGATLQTGTKTNTPVSYDEAKRIYDKLVAEKTAKGYSPGESGTPYQQTGMEARATGLLPQLLNPVDESSARKLIADPLWWMQEKFDGRRMLLRKHGTVVTGINRRGLEVALPETVVTEIRASAADFILDGEAIEDDLFVFDLLAFDGVPFQPRPYLERHLRLLHLLSTWEPRHVHLVETACVDTEKARLFERLKAAGKEGVVLKRIDQPYTAGRPADGGPALKFKFCTTASFRVAGVNARRSVALELVDGERWVAAGNVTIPPNSQMPAAGEVVEVRYLYAFPESGCVYQPVYLGLREDILPEECVVTQLKYKPGPVEQVA